MVLPWSEGSHRWLALACMVLLPAVCYGGLFLVYQSGSLFAPGKFARVVAIGAFIIGFEIFGSILNEGDYGYKFFYKDASDLVTILVLVFGITLMFTKLSLHTAGVGALCGAGFFTGQAWLIPTALVLIAPVFAARHALKAHTPAEQIVGFFAGMIPALLFTIPFWGTGCGVGD